MQEVEGNIYLRIRLFIIQKIFPSVICENL